ncbi:MAG: preprotein translocase subunit SecY [bacterium]
MLSVLANAFRVQDMRKKMIYLLGVFCLYMVGAHIPVPGIDAAAMDNLIGGGTLFGFLDLFSGGSLRRFSIFALGITPYINASIIFQLLTVVVPKLEELAKEGESGRKIITKWTRYLTIGLAFFQASGLYLVLHRSGGILRVDTWFFRILVIVTLVGGTAFLMWLGEQISEKGVGNGVSIIIFIGIIASLPQQVVQTYAQAQLNGNYLGLIALLIISAGTVAFIIYIHKGERKIPVQYAKRVVGRKIYGGQTTYIPLKVNTAGVIPIIFAISVLLFPATIAQFIPYQPLTIFAQKFPSTAYYSIFYFIFVFIFTYFYTAVVFNPKDVAERMKKHGGFILGIRPGKPTAEYLEKIMIRITFMGALFLGFIAVLPQIVVSLTKLDSFGLGGTSILIVVGVALDTIQNIEAQLLMRHYEGF